MKKSRKALSLLLASVLGTTLFATSVVAAACDNEEKPTPPAENPLDKANESVTLSVEGKETKKASEVKKEDVKASGFDESKFQLTVDSITAEDTKLKVKYTLKSLADNSTKEFEKTIEGFLPETPAENPLDKANESVTLSVEGKETKKASEVKKEDVKASGFDESKFQLTVDSITAEDTKLKVKYTLKSLADNSTKEFEKTIEGFLPETPAENPLDKANESVTLSVEGKETKKASEVKKEDVKASGFDESKFQLTVDSITAEDTKLKVKYTLKSLADNSTKEFEKTIEGFLPETPAENPLDKANESVTLSVEGKETKKASEVKKEDVKASGFDESKFQLTVDSITAEDTKLKVKYTLKSLADNSTKEFEKTIEGFLPETPAENPLDKANESVTLSVEGKETKKASEVKKEDVKASGFDESKFQLTVDSITAEDTKLKVKYTLKSLADNSTKEFEKTIEGFLPETPAENPLDKANESVTLSVEGKETKKASEVKKEDVKASGFDESKFQLTVDSITAEDTKLKVKYTLKSLADNSTKEFEKTIEGFLPETPAENPLDKANESVTLSVEGKETKKASEVKKEDVKASGFDESKFQLTVDSITAEDTKLKVKYTLKSLADNSTKEFEKTIEGFLPETPAENPLDKANESVTLSVEGKETKKASEVKKEDVKASGFDESKFQLTVDSITAEDTKLKVKYTLKSLADNSTKEFEKTIEGFLPETPAENPLDKANESVTLSVEGKETKKASEVKKEDVKASGFDESKFQLTVDSITAEDTKLKVKYTLKSLADNSTKEFEKTIEGFLPETPAENPLDKANESVTLSVEGKETKKASEVKKEDVKASGFDESKFQLTVDSITAEDTKLKVKYTLKSLADNSTKEFEKTIEGFLPETPAENPLDKANESVTLSVEGKETKKASEVKKEDVKASGFDESKFQLTVDSITAEDTKLKVKYTLKSLADNSTKEFEKTIEGFLPETPAENPLDKANESVTLSVEGKETKKASEVKKEDVKASGFDESKFQLTVDSITAEDTKLKVKYTLKSLADNSTKEFEKTIEGFLPETPAVPGSPR